jgi:cytochrome c oxidase subunit 2
MGMRRSAQGARLLPVMLLLGTVAGCAANAPSVTRPAGDAADRIARLWWLLFGVSSVVVGAVVILVVAAVVRRRRRPSEGARWPMGLVLGGGVIVPAVVLTALWVLTVTDMHALASPPARPALTVDVIGHRWWWEVRYPDRGVVTANEVHIPVGVSVTVRLSSDDVIHSFWVPQLGPKTDMIPGRVNQTWLRATAAGTYRGQCAEFCGLQHAQMIFQVVAEPPATFDAWLAAQAAPAAAPTSGLAAAGMQVFLTEPCVACHTIRGVSSVPSPPALPQAAQGGEPFTATSGPDLTHVGSRGTIASGALPNTPDALATWIEDAQSVKPGALMPTMSLSPDQVRALVAFLQSLR